MKKWFYLVMLIGLSIPQVQATPTPGKIPGQEIKKIAQNKAAVEQAERIKASKVQADLEAMERKAQSARVVKGGELPPGLDIKDKMPKGLEQQGKTPAGWDKASLAVAKEKAQEKKEKEKEKKEKKKEK